MPTPIPFAAYGAKLGRLRTAPTPHFATALLFLLAALVLLPLLAFIATALWLKSPTVAGIRAAGLWARCRNVAAKFRSEWRSLSEAWAWPIYSTSFLGGRFSGLASFLNRKVGIPFACRIPAISGNEPADLY